MALPLEAGAVQLTLAEPLLAIAETLVGASGAAVVTTRAILFASASVNHRLPSPGPPAMPLGRAGAVNSVTTPAGEMRRALLAEPPPFVYQRLPSGPDAIPVGLLPGVESVGYSVMAPAVVLRPILLEFGSVNQRLPSGPAVIHQAAPDEPRYSVMVPPGVIRPIPGPPVSVNHRLPSAPAAIDTGRTGLPPRYGESANSVMAPVGVIRPILWPKSSVNQRLPSGPVAME